MNIKCSTQQQINSTTTQLNNTQLNACSTQQQLNSTTTQLNNSSNKQLNPTTTQPKNNLTQRLLNSLKNERQQINDDKEGTNSQQSRMRVVPPSIKNCAKSRNYEKPKKRKIELCNSVAQPKVKRHCATKSCAVA